MTSRGGRVYVGTVAHSVVSIEAGTRCVRATYTGLPSPVVAVAVGYSVLCGGAATGEVCVWCEATHVCLVLLRMSVRWQRLAFISHSVLLATTGVSGRWIVWHFPDGKVDIERSVSRMVTLNTATRNHRMGDLIAADPDAGIIVQAEGQPSAVGAGLCPHCPAEVATDHRLLADFWQPPWHKSPTAHPRD
uniref:Uncharacterized protein n=1 Tax=Chrysotila carterae TaxID=13221 RepID=A0A7S4BM26_CHRCT